VNAKFANSKQQKKQIKLVLVTALWHSRVLLPQASTLPFSRLKNFNLFFIKSRLRNSLIEERATRD